MIPRPHLTEGQIELLRSLGLTHRCTDLAIIVEHADSTITRLDMATFDVWMRGFLAGRSEN